MHLQLGPRTALAGLIALAALGAACAGPPEAVDVRVAWREVTPPVVGAPLVAELTLEGPGGKPVTGASIAIEGHMSHPGMAPVLAVAEESQAGVYRVRFEPTMAGDWIVLVKGALPDGRIVRHEVGLSHVRPSG